MKPNTKHLFILIGMVTLLLSLPAIVKSQDSTWDVSHADQLNSEMQNAYNTFLQFVDQGQADTPAGQQAFAAYDSARIRFCDYVAAAPMIDEADGEARRAWEEFKRLRAQGKTDEVGEPRNMNMSDLVGDVEDPLESTYGVFCLTTPPPGYEQGVQISFRVVADGYEPHETTFYIKDYAPSSIKIWGTVTNEKGEPIPGATVMLANPSKTETTDASGSYQLYVETVGTKPYADKLDWVLETKVSAVNITVKPSEIIPIPGEVPLSITATDQDGQPLKNATAIITLVDKDKMPFLAIEKYRGWLGEKGQFSTKLTTRDPAGMDYVYLTDIPLQATLNVEIKDREETSTLGQVDIKRSFNLALIHGVTVGPDMEPRREFDAPEMRDLSPQMLVDRTMNTEGDFWLLVKPYHPVKMQQPKGGWTLYWSVVDRLPLKYPLPNPPAPGELLEVGKIDVLTPEEHEERLKSIVREFIQAMPLKTEYKSEALTALNSVRFQYNSSGAVPYFQDDLTGYGGTIVTPHSKEDYWGKNVANSEDAAYVIMLHELGHFLHHVLVERHFYLHVCYNKYATGGHKTWAVEPPSGLGGLASPNTQLMYRSFAESNADFFAYLAHKFWEQRYSDIKESIYFQQEEYLPEFDDDEKAMAVVSAGTPGFIVEGVQTRFLRAYYGDRAINNPVWVYSDYLHTMLLYMDAAQKLDPLQGLELRPARTIQQWVVSKYMRNQEPGILGLASRYQLSSEPVPSIAPVTTSAPPLVRIGDKTFDFKDFPVVEVPFGVEVEVKGGTMNIDLSTNQERRTLYLTEGTIVILHDKTSVEVKKGVVGVDGPITLRTPSTQVKPSGTIFVVEVAESGQTRVRTFAGHVLVESNAGASRTLGTGEQVDITAQGAMGETTAFDVSAAAKDLLSAPEMPFDSQVLGEYEETPGPSETVLDTQSPTIGNLQPADGAIVTDTPTISADYDNPGGSGIDTDAVMIMVDGVDRTAEATVTDSSIRYEPSGLANGLHEVVVVVSDRDGNRASVSWWFEVQRGTNTLYYGLGLVAALLMGIGALGVLFSRGGLEPALALLASQAAAIRQQIRAGGLHPSQVRPLTGQDRQGRRWSLDPLQERWQLWTGATWQPARPPLARRWGCIVGGLLALGLGGLLGLLMVGLLLSEGLPQTPSIARATATALHQYVPTATSISAPLPSVITPTPQAGLLPDLVIARAKITMRGYTGGCVTEFAPLVTEVCVENRGAAAAGPFVIQAGGGAQWPIEGLAAGEQRCLEGEGDASGQMVTVDASETVAESDETNNTLMVPVPTPPAICTPAPIPATTAPPTETEFVHILAVEVPDQVNTGQSFTITVRLGWSYTEKGTFQVTVRSDSNILGQSGSPGFVAGQDEYTVQYALTAPAEPGPFQFVVEVDGATTLSPSLQDRRDVSVNVAASAGPAELDADAAQTILPSANEIGVDRLDFTDFVMPDEGAGFGALPIFRVSSQDTVVDLMVFASADDAGRFTNQTFSDYQNMGSPPTWTNLGDESFARQGEVLVRVDRYILWALGEVDLNQLGPSVQRLQTFAGGGP